MILWLFDFPFIWNEIKKTVLVCAWVFKTINKNKTTNKIIHVANNNKQGDQY